MNYDRIKQQAGHLPAFQIADAINSTLKGVSKPYCYRSTGSRKIHRAPTHHPRSHPTRQDSDAGTTSPCRPSDSRTDG